MIRSLVFTNLGQLHERDIAVSAMPAVLSDPNLFLWLDLDAPPEAEAREILETVFHFHPLSIEDCIATSPSPKVDEYLPKEDDRFPPYLFMAIHAVDYHREEGAFAMSELNFFLGKNFLVTYHAGPMRCLAHTEDSLIKGNTKVARAPDRVAHLLLDSVADNYKVALDQLADEISDLEEEAFRDTGTGTLNNILRVKKELVRLRQILGPQREVLARFSRGEFKLIRPHLVPYYRDVFNSLFHIAELAQGYSDTLTGIFQVYLNMSSNRTGEIVKLLTMITVITTPLMMIGTWYGMNFKDMPELNWKHGYLIASAIMVASTAATYLYFKLKKWL